MTRYCLVLFNHFHGTMPQLISSQIRTMFKIKWSCFVTGALLSYAPTNSPSASHQLLSDRVNFINKVFVNFFMSFPSLTSWSITAECLGLGVLHGLKQYGCSVRGLDNNFESSNKSEMKNRTSGDVKRRKTKISS